MSLEKTLWKPLSFARRLSFAFLSLRFSGCVLGGECGEGGVREAKKRSGAERRQPALIDEANFSVLRFARRAILTLLHPEELGVCETLMLLPMLTLAAPKLLRGLAQLLLRSLESEEEEDFFFFFPDLRTPLMGDFNEFPTSKLALRFFLLLEVLIVVEALTLLAAKEPPKEEREAVDFAVMGDPPL